MEQVSSIQAAQPNFQGRNAATAPLQQQKQEPVKDGNKKLALALAGLAAIGIGGVVAHKTGALKTIKNHFSKNAKELADSSQEVFANKSGTVAEQGDKLLKESDKITQKAKTEATEMLSQKTKAESLRNQITDFKDWEKAKQEAHTTIDGKHIFEKQVHGKPMSIMTDDSGKILSIQENIDGIGKVRYNYGEDGALKCIREGLETSTDEAGKKISKKASKVYDYTAKGKESIYNNLTTAADSSGEFTQATGFAQKLDYSDSSIGTISKSTHGYSKVKDTETTLGEITYENGKAKTIETGIHKNASYGDKKTADYTEQVFGFNEGKLDSVQETVLGENGTSPINYAKKTADDGTVSFEKIESK